MQRPWCVSATVVYVGGRLDTCAQSTEGEVRFDDARALCVTGAGYINCVRPVPSLPPHMHDAAVTLSTLAGTLLLGTLLRATDVLPRGASRTLLSLCAQLTLPALLLHTLPPALDVALDTPVFALLPLVGLAHLLAVAVR